MTIRTDDIRPSARGISRRDLLRGFATVGAVAAISKLGFAGEPTAPTGPAPVRFAMIGDWGSGDGGEAAVAERMAATHAGTPFDMVVTAGDNIYPNGSGENFGSHFERPFEALIKKDIRFYSCLGNHDIRAGEQAQLDYPLFNMGGRNYYSVTRGGGTVELFMLDSNMMDARQMAWLEGALAKSTAAWKVPVFHHPLYSSGKSHGSDPELKKLLEPLFVRSGVKVAFSGHDHVYQRVTEQQGVQYFVTGAGGRIRPGDLNFGDPLVAKGYDEDSHFMVLDADASKFEFKAINTKGQVVDSGRIEAPKPAKQPAAVALPSRRFWAVG